MCFYCKVWYALSWYMHGVALCDIWYVGVVIYMICYDMSYDSCYAMFSHDIYIVLCNGSPNLQYVSSSSSKKKCVNCDWTCWHTPTTFSRGRNITTRKSGQSSIIRVGVSAARLAGGEAHYEKTGQSHLHAHAHPCEWMRTAARQWTRNAWSRGAQRARGGA